MGQFIDVDKLFLAIAGADAHHCECGFGKQTCFPSARDFTFVEPNPNLFEEACNRYPKATVHHAVIVEDPNISTASFRMCGEQSHLVGIPDSPIFHRHQCSNTDVEIPAKTFDLIDTGFDSVILDMEGAEWFALKHMTSRPRILMIETHSSQTPYRNPFMRQIEEWMTENGYMKLYRGNSNTIWAKRLGSI